MNLKKYMELNIVPLYKNHNFEFQSFDPSEYRFLSSDDDIHIYYRIKRIKRGISVVSREVTSVISIKYFDGRYTFRTDRLTDIADERCVFTCLNNDELNIAMHQLTNLIMNRILPRLLNLKMSFVIIDPYFYTLLSANTEEQAKLFAKKYHKELVYSKEICAWATQWIFDKIPQECMNRKDYFELHIKEIIPFIAFCGELIRLRIKGDWKWIINEDNSDDCVYIIHADGFNGDDGYNILHRVINYWNFAKEMDGCAIFPYLYGEKT